ncbi:MULTISPECIES: glycoside hydrolase family 3 C-terminal domain-containing protein [unclassified Actinomyces]|uniref:glycoside hydrolase family 3 protein n=1 Tax=unclassified Actinomyces TaxID=2609248 RepID=UPI000D59D80E|nr:MULTISPECIES: glycoside hydrolase family 3 C-terminal domain-containing protein [unclassified Actinomyces]RAX21669.1 family 3 glycosyl hydrolase [Actinomyces sp. Z5]RAX21837.1 family 3 glycosyl hydrolase [Actinomyces sp. Z3]
MTTPFDQSVKAVRDGADPFVEAAGLYDRLTADERLGLLDGDVPFWQGMADMMQVGYNSAPYVHGAVERLGIPGTRFVDGPRGCVSGRGTAFPVSMARGATWDVDLEERVGEAIGTEVRAIGGNFFGGVCINLPRHPAWGRIQETYGEDTCILGEMGAALTRGIQRYAMACAKHYALNSMENKRFQVDVTIDDASLHEQYLAHFKRVADEGVAAIMSAYNSVNGQWAGQNRKLLTEVLRDQWGWDGITVSDFIWGLRDAATSLNNGLDLEEPFAQQRAEHLGRQLDSGETSWEMVRRAGLRLLAAQLRSYALREDVPEDDSLLAAEAHRALAREAAVRAMTLLKNEAIDGDPILPLSSRLDTIAVIGRLATAENMGDSGSSMVHPPSHVTPVDGIRSACPNARILLVEDDDPQAAARAASQADVAIVVAGFDKHDEGEWVGGDTMHDPVLFDLFPPLPEGAQAPTGEANAVMTAGYGGDRSRLTLREVDEEIIRAVAAANPRTVVVLVGAGPIMMENWRHEAPAIVMMWYAGMEGGHALADILLGRANPSGRLPFSIPTSEAHLPDFDRDWTTVTYDRWHGQRLLDRLGVEAAFPLGWGLSYTRYRLEAAEIAASTGTGAERVLTVRSRVANTGARDGIQVVQVYGRGGTHADETQLLGFATVAVPAGRTAEVDVPVRLTQLGAWDPLVKRIALADGPVELDVCFHAHDAEAITLRA